MASTFAELNLLLFLCLKILGDRLYTALCKMLQPCISIRSGRIFGATSCVSLDVKQPVTLLAAIPASVFQRAYLFVEQCAQRRLSDLPCMKLPFNKCPYCGRSLPLVPPPSRWVARGFLSMPMFRCPHCEEVICQHVSLKKAIIAFPLGVLVLAFWVQLLRETNALSTHHIQHPGLYGLLGGVVAGIIIGLTIRFSVAFETLSGEKAKTCSSSQFINVCILVGFVVVVLAIGVFTERWIESGVGLIFGIAFWVWLSRLGRKQPGPRSAPKIKNK